MFRILTLLCLPLFLLAFHGGLRAQRVVADTQAKPFRVSVPANVIPSQGSGLSTSSPWHPRLGLVLSGGGARGLAQVGVLRALEEAGIRPDFIVGTSIGSIVGGLYASGYNARRLEQTVRRVDWNAVLRLSDEADRSAIAVDQKTISDRSILTLRFDGLQPVLPQSVSNGQRLTNLLNELALQGLYHEDNFDSLGIPFRAVATDLYSGKRIVMGSGSLAESMRASSTLPVMYAAVARDSMLLVDGGLVANIPVDVAVAAGCDIIVAVNTTSPLRGKGEVTSALETIDQIFNVIMVPQNEPQLALSDVVITPQLRSFQGTDFTAVDTLISLGYAAGQKATTELQRLLLDAVAERMTRPASVADAYRVRSGLPPAEHDPWFNTAHRLDEVYRKAVLMAKDERFTRIDITLDDDGNAEIEGVSAPRLSRIEVIGSTLLSTADLAGVESRWNGQPISSDLDRNVGEYIIEDYRNRGYSLAHIDSVRISDDGKLRAWVDEGIIGRITVRGNTRTNPVVILREIPLREGEVFRISQMKQGMENLLALNLFHHVSYDIVRETNDSHLIVRVVERPSQELQTGLLVDNERNAQLGLLLRDANFLGTGTEIAASFFSGQSNREYALRYSTNRMFYTPFSARVEGYFGFRDFNNYEDVPNLTPDRFDREITYVYRTIAYGAAASFGLYVQRFGNLLGTIRYEQQRIRTDQVRRMDAEPFDEDHRLVELSLSTTIDTQDRFPYPRSGLLFEAEYSSAQAALGSEIAFTRLTIGYDFYVPLISESLILHPRFLFGYGDKTMPRSEEFRLGGLSSFIGMRENEFNGRQIALGGAEIRYTLPVRILFDSYLSLRYDLGRTWENPELIKIEELRHGVGLQLGLDTPIGPADFAIGRSFYLLRNNPETPVRWGPTNLYFSIGVRLR
ncbi:MAG: patatin-like phospholipase family protein [Bacteroidetes bacterium]|nr:patatin-like phospholipase family protein [Bacteroidota bacterium]